jgi:hypothetical protein
MMDGMIAYTFLGGSLLKKRLLRGSGTTSSETLTLPETLKQVVED